MSEKPYVGIIYPHARYKSVPSAKGKLAHQLAFIEEAAEKNGVIPCFFRLHDMKPDGEEIQAYVKDEDGYKRRKIPCPTVIYYRDVDARRDRPFIEKMLDSGKKFFNVRNYDYGKHPVWKKIAENESLAKQLPYTKKATNESIQQMMEMYDSLIIKPNIGAVGRGIMKVEKSGNQWSFTYKEADEQGEETWKTVYFKDKLPAVLTERIQKYYYIVQERINLATIDGEPFDIRVAVQRNHLGEWEPTAMISKVAEKGRFLTNVYQGGTTYTLHSLLKNHPTLSYEKVYKEICTFTLNIAEHLSTKLPHIADLGMDIGVNQDGIPYFIEVNYLSDYETLTFRDDELIAEEWKKVYTTPIDYAAYLLKQP